MFFNTHQCNEHCKSLGLLNPRLESKLPMNFKLVADPEEGKTISSHERIHKLCDLCRCPFETTYGHYFSQREQGFELWCSSCTEKRNNSFKTANCSICGKGFKSSAYWFLMKKTDFPDKCSSCRLANREKMRAALEGIPIEDSKQTASATGRLGDPHYQSEYVIETIESHKKGKGPKISGKKTVEKASKKEEKSSKKTANFQDIINEAETNFPALPGSETSE